MKVRESPILRLFSFFILAFWAGGILAQVNHSDSFEAILSENRPEVITSVQVIRLRDNQLLLERESDRLLSPASLSKLVTAAAALKLLSPAHQFETSFYFRGTRKGTVISGDLIVVGGGDPVFTSEKLWQLSVDLHHLGIRKITGDIVIDNTSWGEVYYDESRLSAEESSYYSYDAPPSAFAVNFNTVGLVVPPGGGNKPNIEFDPYPLPSFKIANHLKWSQPLHPSRIEAFRATRETHSYLILKGQVPKDEMFRKVLRSGGDPIRVSGEMLKTFLQKGGIVVGGGVKAGRLASDAPLLLKIKSEPLGQIVWRMNQYSNNFIADMLVSALGTSQNQEKSENPNHVKTALEKGAQVLSQFLQTEVGLQGSFVLKNGSGLNVDNRLSAQQLTMLLKYVAQDMTLFPEFLASLPAFGVSGTLAERLKDPRLSPLKGVVRAKTGTLTEPVIVSNLAGYIQHPQHGLLAFAILQNGTSSKVECSVQCLREKQDKLLAAVFDITLG